MYATKRLGAVDILHGPQGVLSEPVTQYGVPIVAEKREEADAAWCGEEDLELFKDTSKEHGSSVSRKHEP